VGQAAISLPVAERVGIRVAGGCAESGRYCRDVEDKGCETRSHDSSCDYKEQFAAGFCSKLLRRRVIPHCACATRGEIATQLPMAKTKLSFGFAQDRA
jgi:hypothetical protein